MATQGKKGRVTSLGNVPSKTNAITYIDITKKIIQCSQSTPVFEKKTYHCMWCTFLIKNHPIGCPLQKVAQYKIKVSPETSTRVERIKSEPKYVTHGVFCSVNCVKAFINEHSHNPMYRHSTRLLASMYSDLTGTKGPITIHSAPHYLNLNIFGGEMNENQFKQSFNKIIYSETGTISMYPMTTLFEENANE
jgi:hypothetical protein